MAAAYAALVSLSNVISQTLHPPPTHHFLIPSQQIESLQEPLSSLIDFLEKYSSQETEDLEERIVGAAHEMEDIIESYVVSQIQAKYEIHREIKGSASAACFPSIQKEIRSLIPIQKPLKKKAIVEVIKKIISIREEADEIRKGKGREILFPTAADSSRSVLGGKNVTIGFDGHLNHLRAALATDESRLQIIPVVGMGGIGKTTLATLVYNDAYIIERFYIRAWVSVSLEYNVRGIVLALLRHINSDIEVSELNVEELGLALYRELFGRSYFVVLDDMWDIEVWDELRRYLPDNGNRSRILVTTRLYNLAVGLESCRPYQVSLLNDDSSWALLLEQGFGEEACPDELVNIGKRIARKCGGLPLALVVIGGLLAKIDKTQVSWKYVEENVTSTANDENDEQCMKMLRLSYTQLPVCLKPCFLYLAMFPENVEIRKSRLIKLWVAEGFIKPNSNKSLEDIAEGYLEDLIDRNLIMIKKRGRAGKVKICSIHDLLRDLCRREACRNGFHFIPKLDKPTISSHVKSERRLSIHIGTANDKARKVLRSATVLNRTFLSYLKWDSRRCVARSLNLLRILDVADFYSMEEILRLFNSRYISCGIPRQAHLVPSLISLLWNLQTLVVPWPVYLPSEIWKMQQLRHLKMPGINLPDPSDDQEHTQSIIVLENLQSISTVNNFIFREEVLKRIPNLKKLGICCDSTVKIGVFCLRNLVSLKKLESLVLAWKGTWEDMAFPSSLKKLSLRHCQIPWEDMSLVGSLPNLEVLKIQTRAVKGRVWNPNADEYCRLKFLLIDECEIETWVAEDCRFPCLEHLELVNMKMEEIPLELAEIPTLQKIDLKLCGRYLFDSAKRMSKEREDYGYPEVRVRRVNKYGVVEENKEEDEEFEGEWRRSLLLKEDEFEGGTRKSHFTKRI